MAVDLRPWVVCRSKGMAVRDLVRGPTIVGRMSASEPFDGTRDQGDAMKMFCNLRRLSTRKVCFVVVSRRKRIDSVVF